MRSLGKGILFGCGAILALGIVVGVIVAVISAGMSGEGGEPAQEDIIVRVTGDEGIEFSGSYGELEGSQSVDGVTPQEYEVPIDTGIASIDSVVAVMQKDSAAGELTVQIVRNGEVVAERSTTAEYGLVDLAWSPSD